MKAFDTILVTGAAGHLGTTLCSALIKAGKHVRALCLVGESHIPENADVFYGNVCEPNSMSKFFSGIDAEHTALIHCAGIVSIAAKYDQKVYDVNVNGTKNIVDLCVKHGIGKMIYVSSVHAIPENDGKAIADIGVFNPDDVVGLYAKTKSEATSYVLASVEHGLDAEVVFPSGIIGPNDHGFSHTNTLVADYVNHRLTSAVNGGYDFVDVRDVADGIVSCIKNGEPGEGYILSGGYHSIREILYILHEITGQKEIKRFLPVWFVNLVAPLCELYYKLRREPPLFTRYSVYTLNGNTNFSNEKAEKKLGFNPRNIRLTLSDTVDWLKKTGRI